MEALTSKILIFPLRVEAALIGLGCHLTTQLEEEAEHASAAPGVGQALYRPQGTLSGAAPLPGQPMEMRHTASPGLALGCELAC